MDLLCGQCGHTLRVEDDSPRSEHTCPACGHVIRVPADDAPAGAEADLADEYLTKARLSLRKKLLVRCPSCGERLTVEQGLAGRTILCPECREQIDVPSLNYEKLIEAEETAALDDKAEAVLDVGLPAGEDIPWQEESQAEAEAEEDVDEAAAT